MPVKHCQGQSDHTEHKEQSLRAILNLHVATCERILAKNPRRSYLYIDCNAGSGYNEEVQCDGSPSVFMDTICTRKFRWQAHFVEKSRHNVAELRKLLPEWDAISIHHGDNRDVVPELISEAKPWLTYGLLYHDPNGVPDFDLLTCMPTGCTMDILIRYSGSAVKRSEHITQRKMLDYVQHINKSHWLIQQTQSNDKWQWTFLLGTNWPKFPDYKRIGFVRLDSPEGQMEVERLNYSNAEREAMKQPTFLEYHSYSEYLRTPEFRSVRAEAFRRTGGRCELCGAMATEPHHIRYPKWGTLDTPENLVVVCHKCHCEAHGKEN